MVTAAMAGKPQWYSSASAFAILWQIQQNPKMTHRFPSLSVACLILAALASGRPAWGQAERLPAKAEVDAQHVWRRALAALDQHASVQCKLYQEVQMYDQHLLGHGAYLQGPPGYFWSSLELALKTGGEHDAIVKQRCDGNRLWIFRSMDGLPRLSCVDVKRVLAAARAEGRERTAVPALGIGGLPKLFDAVEKGFRFTDVRQQQLEKKPVFVLRAEWKPDRLLRWLPEQKEAIESGGKLDLSKLPPPVPDHLLIYLGATDLFPRRIEYRRASANVQNPNKEILLLLSFSNIAFDRPVDRRSFVFEPGPMPMADETDSYIRNLGLTPVPEAAAASAAGPTR